MLLVGLGIVVPTAWFSQTDLQNRFSANVNNATLPVWTVLSTSTSYNSNSIYMTNGQWNCVKIVIDHANPNLANDTLVSSIAVWPTSFNFNGISWVEVYASDVVKVIWFDSWNVPNCEPNFNSDNNIIVVEDSNSWNAISADACVRANVPLPIELKTIIARCLWDGQGVKVFWITASEINNAWFLVQKSSDWKRWVDVAWVESAGVWWNSSTELTYTINDLEWTDGDDDGVVYYRLEQNDRDWRIDHSPIRSVSNCDSNEWYSVTVFPNPVVDILRVTIHSQNNDLAQHVEVFNSLGQSVGSVYANDSWNLDVDFSLLPFGVYSLRVTEGEWRNSRTIKVVK